MAEQCCNQFGGRVSVTVDDKRFAPTEADITLDPSNLEITGQANQDGSAAYMAKPKLFGAEITFRQPCGLVWNTEMRKCKIDVTIVEEDNGRTHIFSGARITGSPRVNISKGEVSGLRIEGDTYRGIETL